MDSLIVEIWYRKFFELAFIPGIAFFVSSAAWGKEK